MKRALLLILALALLWGCAPSAPLADVGQLPDMFREIVAQNLFEDITAFDGRLLKAELLSAEDGTRTHRVRMLDVYGKELAACTLSAGDAYSVSTLTVTEDGGFLFVLGFEDFARSQEVWASDGGVASRVIKCDKNGSLQFDTAFDGVEGGALRFCFERDGKFYLFGERQTPMTKTRGVYSPTDIYMAILDENGVLLKEQCIAGSDYDDLQNAEPAGAGFVLSIRSQSEDGDFAGSGSGGYGVDWVITVDEQLAITEKKIASGRDCFDERIGEKDGAPVYQSDALLEDLDVENPSAFIDYGEFYLIVSENITGEYEHTPPMISSIWYYTETVYSVYDPDGKLLFRDTVDSSPDYDAIVAAMEERQND